MFHRLCWALGVGLPPPLHRPSNRQGSCLFCSFLFWHPKTQTFSGWLRITANVFQFEATDSVSSYSLAISLPQCYSGTANTRPDTPSLRSNSAPVWTLQEPPLTSVVNSNYSIFHVCHGCGLKKNSYWLKSRDAADSFSHRNTWCVWSTALFNFKMTYFSVLNINFSGQ